MELVDRSGLLTNTVKESRHETSAEIVLLHIIAKRPEAHPEELRGLDLHPAGALEGLAEDIGPGGELIVDGVRYSAGSVIHL